MSVLYVVATPIGNLGDVTKRQLEVLNACDMILAEDTRHTVKLTNHFDIKVKMISYHKFNEKERAQQIIQRMIEEDLNVALVSDAGTPCISDPGYEIVKSARENEITVIGIPGCSAVITALSISGMDTTSFVFKGFFPRENKAKDKLIKNMKCGKEKVYIFYESPKRIVKFAEYMAKMLPDTLSCFCSDLTKLHEKSFFGNITDVYEILKNDPESELGEYTVVLDISKELETEDEDKDKMSIEALLTDIIVTEKCTIKDAIGILAERSEFGKKQIYQASLNLKQTFENLI